MGDYGDDILAKSKQRNTHLDDLSLILDHMELFQLRLNPKKCTFGVIAGKSLGYIISEECIAFDPEKVQAIMGIPPPRKISQLRSL